MKLPALRVNYRRARPQVASLEQWEQPADWTATLAEIAPVVVEKVQVGSPAAKRMSQPNGLPIFSIATTIWFVGWLGKTWAIWPGTRTFTAACGSAASRAMISSAICIRRILAAFGATSAEQWNNFALGVAFGGVDPVGSIPGDIDRVTSANVRENNRIAGVGFVAGLYHLGATHDATQPQPAVAPVPRVDPHELQILLWNGDPSGARVAPMWRALPVVRG